ncbi:MAG: ABC transporter substrate-binding protein [Actinomycetia bacterium]|nr:ABC transporter substrate-binding protein [Actinomycetes bacterium]
MRCWLIITTLALATLGIWAAACSERSEPVGELEAPFPAAVQDAAETAVTVTEQPARIVALELAGAEFVEALGAADRLVGVPDGFDIGPAGVETVVSPRGRIDIEGIVRLRPDVILATADTDAVELARLQQRLGVPIYIQASRSVDNLVRTAFDLGAILGEPVQARELASGIRERLGLLADRIGGAKPVAVFADMGFFTTPAEGSLFHDLLVRAGAQLVPVDIPAGVAPSPEQIAAAAPAVYFATAESHVALAALRADSDLGTIPAVLDERVVIVETKDVTVLGPGVLDTLERIAAALHPDAFR